MGMVISPESELGKELAKFEQHHSRFTGDSEPGNKYQYRPYPAMLYKAHQRPNGHAACMEPIPQEIDFLTMDHYQRAFLINDAFNRSCQCIVHNEQDADRKRAEGWRESPKAALDHYEALQCEISTAAAEAAYAAQRMSPKAKAELKAADESTHEHITDVVGSSAKTRGKKTKARAVAGQ